MYKRQCRLDNGLYIKMLFQFHNIDVPKAAEFHIFKWDFNFLSCINNYAVHCPNHFPFGVYSLPDTTADYIAGPGVHPYNYELGHGAAFYQPITIMYHDVCA